MASRSRELSDGIQLSILCVLATLFVICSTEKLLYKHPQDASYRPSVMRNDPTVNSWKDIWKSRKRNRDDNDDNNPKCGYQQCDLGKDGFINVHLVPHTHDDVGWLKTVDQYYYNSRNDITSTGGIQYIIDSAIAELQDNPSRRFIYVEIAFFSRWWAEQDSGKQRLIKRLVDEGRLEFILGGWCMNDEATTHYSAIIDQHALGFRFLKENFGECGRPKIGWQIDPFGHSREQASLFAQFGFDGLFLGRIDYQDKDARLGSKTMELVWRASDSLGDQSSLFTGINFIMYQPPDTFCFECNDPPIMDDPRLENYNVDKRVNEFVSVIEHQALYYTTNHIMLTMGNDFQYMNAHVNFKNFDKLINYTNALQATGSKINVFYSTPSCYLYALNRANLTYTHKQDDFFPYAIFPHGFLTGFYTSRPALKGYERTVNNLFQVCKQLDALTQLTEQFNRTKKLFSLSDAMGIIQHHDAVSGTEKQHVANDYARRLSFGAAQCQDLVNAAYSRLLPTSPAITAPTLQFCSLLNVSFCPVTEISKKFAVVIYNPFGRAVSYWTRIPVSGSNYVITDSQLKTVNAQIVPLTNITRHLPDHKGSLATGELVFLSSLPPLGFTTYFITAVAPVPVANDDSVAESYSASASNVHEDIVIENEHLSISFNSTTGLLTTLTNTDKSISIDLNQSLGYYRSYYLPWPPSGAYIFRPIHTTVHPVGLGPVKITVVKGSQVQEVHQVFSDWASQVVRLYNGARQLEIEWTVGPIPIADTDGKEIISRFSTSLQTNATFYTDANGREVLKRVRNYRPSWKFTQTEPVAGNYYPVTSRIYIQDVKRNIQLTVLNDRSQGGSSINDGDMELMLHRRLLMDDNLGVGEPLNETGIGGKGLIVRGKHYVYLDDIASSVHLHRDAAQRIYMSPYLGFTPLQSTVEDYVKKFKTTWSGLNGRLPDNVHLLTLEQLEAGTLLLRLEHFYEKNEDQLMSQPATVQLKELFEPFSIKSVVELTLGGNQVLADTKRLQWNVQDFGRTQSDMSSFVVPVDPAKLEVVLRPMQIRTFELLLKSTGD